MGLLPPSLLRKLGRSRIEPLRAAARHGVGERRSRATGAGIEFAEHREYQAGDDIRYLDRHVFSRLGQHVIKRYHLYQQLQITILVDATASMGFGEPPKLRRAAQLGGVLAHVGLTGGDKVQVGILSGGGIDWYRQLEGVRRAPELFTWLDKIEPRGTCELAAIARDTLHRLQPGGLLVIISDWLDGRVDEALSVWRSADQELVGVRLLSPEELEPERLGNGPVRLTDLETGRQVEVALDAQGFAGYRDALASWGDRLSESFYRQEGRLFATSSDDDLDRVVLNEWRASKLIS